MGAWYSVEPEDLTPVVTSELGVVTIKRGKMIERLEINLDAQGVERLRKSIVAGMGTAEALAVAYRGYS